MIDIDRSTGRARVAEYRAAFWAKQRRTDSVVLSLLALALAIVIVSAAIALR